VDGTERPAVILTIDFEDWEQIVGRAIGTADWDAPHDGFHRQAEATLALLRAAGVRATFFVLGMTARNYPHIVERLAAEGHEIACHGYTHTRVWEQGRSEFRRDVERCLSLLDDVGVPPPRGYRAPAFSLTSRTLWAFDVLADLEFRYDSSHYASPKISDRLPPANTPYRIAREPERGLWELPVAVTAVAGRRVPVGGGSYWRVLPRRVIFGGLDRLAAAHSFPVLYFHPYELGALSLRVKLPPRAPVRQRAAAAWYAVRYNPCRARIVPLVAAAAERFRLVTCAEALPDVERAF
jgi:polysaccharide deacetylase family protein (PEP-CTERM system associated)